MIEGAVRPVPYERPSTDVIAERVVDGVAWYTFAQCAETVVGRVYRLADFVIDTESRQVIFHRDPACDPEIVAILLTGTVTAFLLSAKGALVLHASAVEVDSEAVAFVGLSGQGKTTVATLLCTEGYPLVTDDLLPVEAHGGEVTCVPGGIELRVREKSQELADWLASEVPRRRTADDRLAVAVPVTNVDRLPLATVVIPLPDRQSREVSAHRLSAGEAAMFLARFQRIEGWTSPNVLACAVRSDYRHRGDCARARDAHPLGAALPWRPGCRDHDDIAAAAPLGGSTPFELRKSGRTLV